MRTRASEGNACRGGGLLIMLVLSAAIGMLVPRPVLGQVAGSVQGTVANEADGTPLEGAVVTLEEIRSSATTGSDGRLAIEDVPGGVQPQRAPGGLRAAGDAGDGDGGRAAPARPAGAVGGVRGGGSGHGVFSELYLRDETEIGSRLPLQPMQVPASIGIIDATAIERRGYLRLSDVMEGMACVIVGQFPAEPTSFSMRGFTRSQVTALRDNIWLGPANMTMRRQNTFNLDRVELLRGPSSVINGQGAVAGTINAVTKQAQPTAATEWSSLLSYGQFNAYQASLGVNGPASDTVFYRFNASHY